MTTVLESIESCEGLARRAASLAWGKLGTDDRRALGSVVVRSSGETQLDNVGATLSDRLWLARLVYPSDPAMALTPWGLLVLEVGLADRTGDKFDPVTGEIHGRWFVTPHAVERMLERHGAALGLTNRAAALAWIIEESMVAKFAHPTVTGNPVWVGRRPRRIRYVLGDLPIELAGQPGAKPPLITVLAHGRKSGPPR
jgi:hypothetical protein